MSSAPAAEHGGGVHAGRDQLSTVLSAAPPSDDAGLLPAELPQVPGTALASRYLPGTADVEVGGDWYDVIALDPAGWCWSIGDVVGKGQAGARRWGSCATRCGRTSWRVSIRASR